MLMVPDAILEASKLANVVEIVTLPPKSDETLPVTAPDSAMVLAARNLVAVGALSVLRAYLSLIQKLLYLLAIVFTLKICHITIIFFQI